ncbi:MAG: nucleotidyltransferase family protein [Ignisphaera sp.]|uniref:Nucleotidyltransferase family protein n=1 Tax=Ignisphaera aggregans TaxID=334771 RepID=A0A7J3JRK3_9CREN
MLSTRDVVGVILAGGEGSRFKPYTDIIPKPMIPIGYDERPILEHIVCWLKRFGISKYVFLVGYKWKQIRNYFNNGSRHGVEIRYSIDDEIHKGTGGALLKAFKCGLIDNIVLIWYGDILALVDIHDLLNKHFAWNSDAVVVLADRYQVPVGVASIDGNRIVKLEEKPWLDLYVTIGVLTLNLSILKEVEKTMGTSFDIMSDLIPWMISKGFNVRAYLYRGTWYDIGSLERYRKMDPEAVKGFLCQ